MKKKFKLADQEILYSLLTNRHINAKEIVIDTENKVVDVYSLTKETAARHHIPRTAQRFATSELGVLNLDTDVETPLEEYKFINYSTLTTEQKEIIERLLSLGNSIQTAATKALRPKPTKEDIIVALTFARYLKIEDYGTTSEETKEA